MGLRLLRTTQVELPPTVVRLLNVFSTVVSFGIAGVDSVLQCLGTRGYFNTLLLYIVTPLVLTIAVLLVSFGRMICLRTCTFAALIEMAVPAVLKPFFIAYPLVTRLAFGPHHVSTRTLSAVCTLTAHTNSRHHVRHTCVRRPPPH